MRGSLWNQYFEHREVVNLSPDKVYEKLLSYYKLSSENFVLENEEPPKRFSFSLGKLISSALGSSSELKLKHYVDVAIDEIEEGKTQIYWHITMKFFGLQIGKNHILEECKRMGQEISKQ